MDQPPSFSSKESDPALQIERAGISVFPDQKEKLAHYKRLLIRWQKAINLVSSTTLSSVENRHFLDSAQILPHIPPTCQTLVDLGSGAGFPGLVLAMLRPEISVHLVESDQKKCAFLETVSRETRTPVTVHCARIESLAGDFPVDVVTARALAPLRILLDYAAPWFENNSRTKAIFLKGGDFAAETAEARTDWAFEMQNEKSLSDPQGRLLCLEKIRRCPKI